MVLGKKFGCNILKKPMETVRGFEVASSSYLAQEHTRRLKNEADVVSLVSDEMNPRSDVNPFSEVFVALVES